MSEQLNNISVIMPTSPIPDNPDTSILEETLASVRDRLLDVEIFIVHDGVRQQQIEQRRKPYQEFTRRVLWKAEHEWHNVLPIVLPEWGHQANATRAALTKVRTPLILFVEHDTPLIGEFPWNDLVAACKDDRVNLIRFHHEANILEPHQYLMVEKFAQDVCGVPLTKTAQWSQRPHLAKTEFYRGIIETYFGAESRTMIEDAMHGVLHQAWLEEGYPGWDKFRTWMYTPEGDIKRSFHLDGRKDDPKYDMYYEYSNHETPWGAPARTAGRTD